jgi:hypothetical protein
LDKQARAGAAGLKEIEQVKERTLLVAVASLTAAAAMAADAPKGWFDTVSIKGDIRYRYEDIQDDSKTNSNPRSAEDDRQRERIRVRASIEAKINDNLKAVVGLTTTEKGDPVSGNQTLTDEGTKKSIYLDLGYIDWTVVPWTVNPEFPVNVKLLAGKMKNPFLNVSDLVFDGDLTPEGLAINTKFGNDMFSAMVNGGRFWIKEIKTGKPDDIMMNGAQLALRFEPIPEVSLTVGASKYVFDNVADTLASTLAYDAADSTYNNSSYSVTTTTRVSYAVSPAVDTGTGVTTNSLALSTVASAKYFKYDYDITEYFAELSMNFGIPVSIVAQMISNGDADKDEKGSLYGVTVGKAKNLGTFEVGYFLTELERDATFGPWTDSDRWGGGTDGKGQKIVAKYQFMKNLQLGATYFMNDKIISDDAKTRDYSRLQVDLVMTF